MASEHSDSIKVSFIGDSCVGKTSIINRKVKGTFVNNLSNTIGSSHIVLQYKIDDKTIEMCLWDTAGQEKYASLVPLYVRNSKVICVVASINDPQSISNIDKWIVNASEECCNAVIVVIINKIDLHGDDIPTKDQIVEELAQKHENLFFVSALDATGIDDTFEFIARAGTSGYERCLNDNDESAIKLNEKEKKSGCC